MIAAVIAVPVAGAWFALAVIVWSRLGRRDEHAGQDNQRREGRHQ